PGETLVPQRGGPAHVEMVEGIPSPDHIEIRIENDDHVAQDVDSSQALNPAQHLLDACQHGNIPVRQTQRFMVKGIDLALSENLQLLIDTARVRLPYGQSDQIEFTEHLMPWVSGRVLHDSEKRAVAGGPRHEGQRRARVKPDHVSIEVRSELGGKRVLLQDAWLG